MGKGHATRGHDGTHNESGRPILHLPSVRALLRHAVPSVLEGTVGPVVLFSVVLRLAGFRGAVVTALAWSVLALARRVIRRERVPGLLVLATVLVSARAAVSLLTGSAFLYFVQPMLGTALVAMLFLASAAVRRPLAARLAHDFCPFEPHIMSMPCVRTFFTRISLLWGAVLLVNAASTLWLLMASSLGSFVIERAVLSSSLMALGIAFSTWWFTRVMRASDVALRWGRAEAAS